MCGLIGFCITGYRADGTGLDDLAGRMAETLRHRGPDSGGVWSDPEAGVALGHRRLAIVDLSAEGHQPMVSASGRYVIVFNGEIYNFRELRAGLEAQGERFRGHSDTEVLLAAIERRGLERTLEQSVGMFALAVWDRQERTLHLARDRLGKKPLYFGWIGDTFAFASELKALRVHPRFAAEVDRDALDLFLRHQYVPGPFTIYRDLFKLPPASRLSLPFGAGAAPRDRRLLGLVQSYWSMRSLAESGAAARPLDGAAGDEAALVDAFEDRLALAVRERMIADVPLGAFLSGGIDSSVVVALMQKQAVQPVKTFTIGFLESSHDEKAKARAVARHLGTEHHEFDVTPAEAREVVPQLPFIYDEPFADPSQIPTCHVARLARTKVTVCISGDGGDELLGGYQRHLLGARLEPLLHSVPLALRRRLAAGIRQIPAARWDDALRLARFGRQRSGRSALSGDRLHKFTELLAANGRSELYWSLMNPIGDLGSATIGADRYRRGLADLVPTPRIDDFTHLMMYYDTISYLPDDILVKVDRASMAVGLEVRAPLLDHRVVEHVWSLPRACKLRPPHGKWLLRRLFERHLPPALLRAPKQGFGIPLADWLRVPLREWAEDLLNARRLEEEGFFRMDSIRARWREHLSGERNWSAFLWSVLMFQAWHARWVRDQSSAADGHDSRRLEPLPAA